LADRPEADSDYWCTNKNGVRASDANHQECENTRREEYDKTIKEEGKNTKSIELQKTRIFSTVWLLDYLSP
jgi:hypothetical protein